MRKLVLPLLLLLFVMSLSVEAMPEGRLAEIRLLEGTATLGRPVSVLVYAEQFTGDLNLDTLVEAEYEGESVDLERYGAGLWRFKTPVLDVMKAYAFTAKVYIEDKRQGDITRKEIENLNKSIQKLNVKIEKESDPTHKEELSHERDNLIIDRQDLENYLITLKTYVGKEDFVFSPSNPFLPFF